MVTPDSSAPPDAQDADGTSRRPASALRRSNISSKVRNDAVDMLYERPDGMRFAELVQALHRKYPDRTEKAIRGHVAGLEYALATKVFRPAKGLYFHCRFKTEEMILQIQQTPPTRSRSRVGSTAWLPEVVFYESLANRLRDELQEITRVIKHGRDDLLGRWGTPGVLGKFEAGPGGTKSQAPLIVAAELMVDLRDLLEGFGKACAHRLFAHKSYLAIPQHTPAGEVEILEALCRMHGIGLLMFDARQHARPAYRLLERAIQHQPDSTRANVYARSTKSMRYEP